MKIFFADTSYFIAFIDQKDRLYETVKSVSQNLSPMYLVTTELVFVELLNAFSAHGLYLREFTADTIEKMYKNINIKIIPLDSQCFKTGLLMYKKYKDKSWSLTDCVSFIAMKNENISEALTADKHFEQAGFNVLLK